MKLQFGLRSIAFAIIVCAILAYGTKQYYDSLPGPLIPFGTDCELAAAIHDAFENPPNDGQAMRPGWATIAHTPAMKKIAAFGDDAIPVLVANLRNRDQVMRLQACELLTIIDAESAVPDLVDALRYDGSGDDAFIVAKLAEITDHPDGYRFYRTWGSAETQKEATEAYRAWHAKHQLAKKEQPEP